MTEVPEHLLQRSRARRAALGLGGEAGDLPVPAATATPQATPAAAAVAAPVEAAPVAPKPPERVPPYVEAALKRKKIPYWVLPILIMLPVWGIVYALTLDKPSPKVAGPLTTGATQFSACAACHGATGLGGVGPKLAGGAVLAQFPNIQDHLYWVMEGSAGFKAKGIPTYGTKNTSVDAGNMPGWATQLDAVHLIGVVRYERETLSGQKVTDADLTKEYADILAMIKKEFPDRVGEFQTAIDGFKGLPRDLLIGRRGARTAP